MCERTSRAHAKRKYASFRERSRWRASILLLLRIWKTIRRVCPTRQGWCDVCAGPNSCCEPVVCHRYQPSTSQHLCGVLLTVLDAVNELLWVLYPKPCALKTSAIMRRENNGCSDGMCSTDVTSFLSLPRAKGFGTSLTPTSCSPESNALLLWPGARTTRDALMRSPSAESKHKGGCHSCGGMTQASGDKISAEGNRRGRDA